MTKESIYNKSLDEEELSITEMAAGLKRNASTSNVDNLKKIKSNSPRNGPSKYNNESINSENDENDAELINFKKPILTKERL